jgi:hypothetical protein
VKCELVKPCREDEDLHIFFEGTIDCAPGECQVIMHKGQAFVYDEDMTEADLAVYVLTKIAEFTEAED